MNKRRSLAFTVQNTGQIQQQHVQMRGKPAMDIYRPPSKFLYIFICKFKMFVLNANLDIHLYNLQFIHKIFLI